MVNGTGSGVIVYATVGKWLKLSGPQFTHLQNGGNVIYPSG